MAAGQFYINQFFPFIQIDGKQSAFTGRTEFLYTGPLYNPLIGGHEEEFIFIGADPAFYSDNRIDLFIFFQRQQVTDIGSLSRLAGFRNLIPLLPVHTAPVSKEENVVMGAGHQQMLRKITLHLVIFLDDFSAAGLDAAPSPVLVPEIGQCLAFDIALMANGNHDVFFCNQIFRIQFAGIRYNGSSPGIPKAFLFI